MLSQYSCLILSFLFPTNDIQIYLFILNLSTTQINTKKMGDNEKTIWSSVSAATLLKVNILINTFNANYICKFGHFSNKNIRF